MSSTRGVTPFSGPTRDPRFRVAAGAQIALIHRGRHPIGGDEPPNSPGPRAFKWRAPLRRSRRKRPMRLPPTRHAAPAFPRSSYGGRANPRIAARGKTRKLVWRYDQLSPCFNAARMVLRRLRIMAAGELVGAWDKIGGSGAQLRLLPNHLEVCIESNAKDTARLSEEECDLLSHMARSRMAPSELASIISEPDRGRRLRVVDEQRRAHHPRTAQSGGSKKYRGQASSSARGRSKGGRREHAPKNARKKRYRQERGSEPRQPTKNFPAEK